jgi:hypothetical protein
MREGRLKSLGLSDGWLLDGKFWNHGDELPVTIDDLASPLGQMEEGGEDAD